MSGLINTLVVITALYVEGGYRKGGVGSTKVMSSVHMTKGAQLHLWVAFFLLQVNKVLTQTVGPWASEVVWLPKQSQYHTESTGGGCAVMCQQAKASWWDSQDGTAGRPVPVEGCISWDKRDACFSWPSEVPIWSKGCFIFFCWALVVRTYLGINFSFIEIISQ